VDALWAMNLLTAADVTTHLTVAEILAKAEQLIRFAPPGEEEAAT
jgi:hypothetical protein